MPIVTLRRLAVASSMALLVACQDETISPPREAPIIAVPSGAVQAVIQQEPATTDGLVTFVVRVLANNLTVSAFQGSVTFAPGSFELVEKRTPAGPGGMTVLNAEGFAEGRIRFGSLTATQFDSIAVGSGIEAFRFTVRPLRPVGESNLLATLEVVGTDMGATVGADRMLASSGVMVAGRSTR
jgi:hypothetical protein